MNVRHLRSEQLRGLRWRGYVRESTQEQTDKWSPIRQRRDLERAADELGLVGDPFFYERTGSGESDSTELLEALADAKRGEYDVLLVLHTSRFARNRAEAVRVKALARRWGPIIYFVEQRIISGARSSGLHEGIAEVIDEHANEERRYWIAGGNRERHKAGLWLGNVPIGYRKHMAPNPDRSVTWDGTLEPDPEWAPIVRIIFTEYADGATARAIGGDLEEALSEPAGAWHRTRIERILRNPVYTGQVVRYRLDDPNHYFPESDPHDGRQVVGACPAIVGPALWARVQLRLRRQAARRRRAA